MVTQKDFSSKSRQYNGCGPAAAVTLISELYDLMKPGAGGTYVPEFISGTNVFLKEVGLNWKAEGFWIRSNERKDKRKYDGKFYKFCADFLKNHENDKVAFLTLDSMRKLPFVSWHWNIMSGKEILNNGFNLWYETCNKRGGLVALKKGELLK